MWNFVKKNWDAILAFLFIWVAPLMMILIQGVSFFKHNDELGVRFELAGVILLGIILIVYFTAGQKWVDQKLMINEIKNEVKSPFLVFLQGLITCISIGFAYLLIHLLQSFCSDIGAYVKLILVFEIIGAVLNFIHALRKVDAQ